MLLALAIAFEITGTLFMKWSNVNDNQLGYFLMLVMIALSYISLSISIKKIALGVAYAMWEGVGILFITLFSVLLFDESVSVFKMVGLVTLVVGIALIKCGTQSKSRGQHARV